MGLIDTANYKICNMMHTPHLYFAGVNTEGLHEMVYNSIMSCAIDTRPDISCNVMLGGGSSMFPGSSLTPNYNVHYIVGQL